MSACTHPIVSVCRVRLTVSLVFRGNTNSPLTVEAWQMLIGFQDNILSSFILTYACGIWPFLLSWNYSHYMENKEEEVFCVPCWYCPLIQLQEVNSQKFFTCWFFYFPHKFDFFFLTFFLLSSPLTPARTFLKVFWNYYLRLGRLLLLAISFVSSESSFPKEIWFHHYVWQNLKECANLHMINHRGEAILTCSCGHFSKHLLEGWICAWLRQLQKCWSCHNGALLTIHSTKVSTQHLTVLSPALLPPSPPARQWFGVGVYVCWSFCGVLAGA